ncbi:hypothetical protein D3C80_470220 [compost metagenome]
MLMIDQKMIFACGGIFENLQIRVFFQLCHARERYKNRGIQLTGLHVEHTRIIVRNRDPLYPVELNTIRLPEIRILFQNNPVTTTPFVHHKRTRCHWFFCVAILTQLLQSLLGKNRNIRECERGQEWRGRRFEFNDQRMRISSFGSVHDLIRVAPKRSWIVANTQKRKSGIIGRDRRSIRKFSIAQLERIGETVIRNRPAFSKTRLEFRACLVDPHQHIINV